MLIQIEFKKSFLLEIFVGVWQELRILFNLSDFVEVFSKNFRAIRGTNPLSCLFDDFLNYLVFDNFFDIDRVMSLFENAILAVVFYFHIVQQLQPQIFQFIRVIFEQIEVVSHSGQYLVKLCL